MTLRIAFDIAALDRGGAERQTLEVAAGLAERGHDVLVIVNNSAENFDEYFRRVQITELRRHSRWDARVMLDIRLTLRAFKPDVCVCVLFNASLWGRLSALSMGCPVVVAEHSTKIRTPWAEYLTNVALRRATSAVIACAQAQVDALVRGGHPRRRVRVVRNGVSLVRFAPDRDGALELRDQLGIPAGDGLVMLAAAHRREKRQDRFIRLIEQLHAAGTLAWGVMVGGGPLLERTAALAEASPVRGWLRITGAVADMPAAYSAADLVVLVSDDIETFPLSFLEAQACRVPVVGVDTGGVRESLIDGRTGFVVAQGDLRAMTGCVAKLLADPKRRAVLGTAGREFVESQLSTGAMVDGYLSVLRVVAEGARCARREGRRPR